MSSGNQKLARALIAAAVATGTWLWGSGNAHADERTAAVWDRHFAIAGHIDMLPIPLTDVLAVVELAPARVVSLEVGGGASFVQQPLFLAMLHLQLPLGHWVPGVEAGMLTGPLRWSPGQSTIGVMFASDDVGYSYREHVDAAVF